MKNTIHITGIPTNPAIRELSPDPFARSAYFLTNLLHANGWKVYYYGYEECNVKCSKKIDVVNLKWRKDIANIDIDAFGPAVASIKYDREFNSKLLPCLNKNLEDGDIIICTWSRQVEDIVNNLEKDVKVIDGHIGHHYPSKLTKYHAYTSDALRSWIYGKHHEIYKNRWNHVTIPPMSTSIDDFKYLENKEDYFLYMSRLMDVKGIDIFLKLAETLPNEKFKLAGSGSTDKYKLPKNVEFLGILDIENRREYMSKSKAVITPAKYFEPFGLTAIEAALSGTPIITTDWGGYTNSVVDGVTGYRCKNLCDFLNAIHSLDKISSINCRTWGEKYVTEYLISKWETYLTDVIRDDFYDIRIQKELKSNF